MRSNLKNSSSLYSEQTSAKGEFWVGTDLEDDETEVLTIDAYSIEELKSPDGKSEEKVILDFKEDPRRLVLNKTRGRALAKIFGDDMQEWVDKRVELFCTETAMGPGVRVRATKNKPSKAADYARDNDRDDERPKRKAEPASRRGDKEDRRRNDD